MQDDRQAPLVGVTGRRRSARGVHSGPPALDRLTLEIYFAGYSEQVAAAGGLAVHLPAGTDPRVAADRLDGLILTGGSDVDPARYGGPPAEGGEAVEPERDEIELALLAAALDRELPVLAICRGLQLVNVSRGGTLHAHLGGHPAGREHELLVEPGSILAGLHGPSCTVNSLHHQGADRIGRDLVVTARAPDGVVEGIELPGADLLGVQWHPEQMDGPQPEFGWLVDAARARTGIR